MTPAAQLAPELYERRQALADAVAAHQQSEAAPAAEDPAPIILHATRPRLVHGLQLQSALPRRHG